ncbi:mitochondrial fission process protein 1 [Geosmithia morbida]|uniref:Mitochondrial fission process protein 1 n=1 Tax=Geosmithia morbida TaxID=1094350 RepID=A0A9P4Z4H5_9HYPO|nr:mitochondrial fission process protein 1 [Geosmithia morbida]KAF4126494.1 mitochondrial fission process protein 1 [Geosmithia morbida]
MPWWGKSSNDDKPPKPGSESASTSGKASFDPETLPKTRKLPDGLQKIVDDADEDSSIFDDIADGVGPASTDSSIRYAAYATRIRTIMMSAHRYVAYTSDIGESFRPVAHPILVRSAYGISWAYILGDVSYEGYRAYWQNQRKVNPQVQLTPQQEKVTGLPSIVPAPDRKAEPVTPLEDWRTVMAQRAIFQSVASMGLPAFTIHSVVRYSGRLMKNMKNKTVRTWGPIGLGLAVVPLLPSMFDEPVENAVEWLFHKGFEAYGGKNYVGNMPETGREDLLNKIPKIKGH